jgi:hypothetical protein
MRMTGENLGQTAPGPEVGAVPNTQVHDILEARAMAEAEHPIREAARVMIDHELVSPDAIHTTALRITLNAVANEARRTYRNGGYVFEADRHNRTVAFIHQVEAPTAGPPAPRAETRPSIGAEWLKRRAVRLRYFDEPHARRTRSGGRIEAGVGLLDAGNSLGRDLETTVAEPDTNQLLELMEQGGHREGIVIGFAQSIDSGRGSRPLNYSELFHSKSSEPAMTVTYVAADAQGPRSQAGGNPLTMPMVIEGSELRATLQLIRQQPNVLRRMARSLVVSAQGESGGATQEGWGRALARFDELNRAESVMPVIVNVGEQQKRGHLTVPPRSSSSRQQ